MPFISKRKNNLGYQKGHIANQKNTIRIQTICLEGMIIIQVQ